MPLSVKSISIVWSSFILGLINFEKPPVKNNQLLGFQRIDLKVP